MPVALRKLLRRGYLRPFPRPTLSGWLSGLVTFSAGLLLFDLSFSQGQIHDISPRAQCLSVIVAALSIATIVARFIEYRRQRRREGHG